MRQKSYSRPPNFDWVNSTLDMVRHFARAEMDDKTILEMSRKFAPPDRWSDLYDALVTAAIPIARMEHCERAQYRAAERADKNHI